MMGSLRVLFGAAVGAATLGALCACGGSNPYSPPNDQPCGAPSGQVALAYPAPGSTGIPDNLGGIIFASSKGLTSGYQAYVVPVGAAYNGQYFEPVEPAPSPLPSPNATPPFANPIYQESGTPFGDVLTADTQYNVYLNDGNTNCVPTTVLGTFTSQ